MKARQSTKGNAATAIPVHAATARNEPVGPTKYHSAPPTTHPCFYGIDTPNRSELVAASHTIEEIGRYVTCDSIAYLSHDGMMAAVGADKAGTGYCSACFTGNYPVALGQRNPDLVQLRRAK